MEGSENSVEVQFRQQLYCRQARECALRLDSEDSMIQTRDYAVNVGAGDR